MDRWASNDLLDCVKYGGFAIMDLIRKQKGANHGNAKR